MRTLLAAAAAAALAIYYHDNIAANPSVKALKGITSLSALQASIEKTLAAMDPEHLAFIAGFVFMTVFGGLVVSWLAAKVSRIVDLEPQ